MRHVHNPGTQAIFVAGVLIPAGEGREVHEPFAPAEEGAAPAPADAPPDLDANLRELLAQPVKGLVPQLEGFGTDTLDGLARLEGADATPRKTLLSAIAELKLQRAAAKTAAG